MMNHGDGAMVTSDDDIGALLARYEAVKKAEAPWSSAVLEPSFCGALPAVV